MLAHILIGEPVPTSPEYALIRPAASLAFAQAFSYHLLAHIEAGKP